MTCHLFLRPSLDRACTPPTGNGMEAQQFAKHDDLCQSAVDLTPPADTQRRDDAARMDLRVACVPPCETAAGASLLPAVLFTPIHEDMGAPASRSGSCASHGTAYGVSALRAAIPSAGEGPC